jgi:formylglycine-generating enzyme required for sulfatase activity
MPDRDLVDKPQDNLSSAAPPRGKNYLLAIAINAYQHCTPLNNAVKDVEAFVQLLLSRYAFEQDNITFIKDAEASKRNIEQAFLRLIKTVTPNDNLIVYFSGHGRYDENFGGNWVPVEAGTSEEDWPDYLSNDQVKSYLGRIKSRHTFLIADSCFSGTLFAEKSKERDLSNRTDTEPSRWALTSGKKEIVSDGQSGQHSPFASALLDVLRKAAAPPSVMEICTLVLEKVAANALQTPMASPLGVPGHQGGQMVFYFKTDEESEWKTLSRSVEGCRTYLSRFPQGKYQHLAAERIALEEAAQAWALAKTSTQAYRLLEYEQKYPNSEPVRSGELHRLLGTIAENELWREAQQANTLFAYRDYLHRSTLQLHAQEAESLIKSMAAREKEDTIWRQAWQSNTIAGLQGYLQEYPRGRYAGQADWLMLQLQKQVEEKKRVEQGEQSYATITPEATVTKEKANFGRDTPVSSVKPKQKNESSGFERVASILGVLIGLVVFAYVVSLLAPQNLKQSDKSSSTKSKEGTVPFPEMVAVPGGTFEMGDVMGDQERNDEQVHSVTLSDFKIGKTEVTFEEYDRFCGATQRAKPDDEGWGRGQYPVINVSWYDAIAYCNWLSEQHGLQVVYSGTGNTINANWEANGYRLPTEAEWEYAARGGGKKVRFGNGKDVAVEDVREINFYVLKEKNNNPFLAGLRRATHVASLNSPNTLGLHDMSGNVWEWCWDWYAGDYYTKSSKANPTGPTTGEARVLRGGSWSDLLDFCRSAYRNNNSPDYRNSNVGLRLVRQ